MLYLTFETWKLYRENVSINSNILYLHQDTEQRRWSRVLVTFLAVWRSSAEDHAFPVYECHGCMQGMRHNTIHHMSRVIIVNAELRFKSSIELSKFSLFQSRKLDNTVPEWQAQRHCSDRERSSMATALSREKHSPRLLYYQDHMTVVG